MSFRFGTLVGIDADRASWASRDHIFYDPTITVQTMAACAAYAAVLRYATRGRDEYPIAPRDISELRAVLYVQYYHFLLSLVSC